MAPSPPATPERPTDGRSGRGVRGRAITASEGAAAALVSVRTAAPSEVDVVLDVLSDAAAWARRAHNHPWPDRFPREVVAGGVAAGAVLVAVVSDAVVGTADVETADALWGPRDDAVFVHRLAIRHSARGRGVGGALVGEAARRAAAAGRWYVCLDCSAHNPGLRRHYEAMGFVHRRDEDVLFPDLRDPSQFVAYRGSLYERPATPMPPHGPHATTTGGAPDSSSAPTS